MYWNKKILNIFPKSFVFKKIFIYVLLFTNNHFCLFLLYILGILFSKINVCRTDCGHFKYFFLLRFLRNELLHNFITLERFYKTKRSQIPCIGKNKYASSAFSDNKIFQLTCERILSVTKCVAYMGSFMLSSTFLIQSRNAYEVKENDSKKQMNCS